MKKYKPYLQNQLCFPPSLDEMIGEKDLVRVVDHVVESLDHNMIGQYFKGGGRPAHDPVMMLKVLVYAYCNKIYSCRNIAKAMKRDIAFMWLSGMQYPDFNTVNRFRGVCLKDVLEDVFAQVVRFLIENGYVATRDYFVDGTKFEADAGKYTCVWRKNAERFAKAVRKRASEILKEVERINEEEDELYEKRDLPEYGGENDLDSETLKKAASEIAGLINDETAKKKRRSVVSKSRKLEKEAEKLEKYEKQLEIIGDRNSYSKTDKDAVFMRLKNTDELRAAYNVQIGTQNSFVTGLSVSQNANDASAFIEHMENRERLDLPDVENVAADAIYGTEENYDYMERTGNSGGGYLKYPLFYKESKGDLPAFGGESFEYDKPEDVYYCPRGRRLDFLKEEKRKSKNGFVSELRVYECADCGNCPSSKLCLKGKIKTNRSLWVNERLDKFRREVGERLRSEKGIELRKRRGPEVETPFGDVKHNMGYRRVRLRGKEKALVEMSLVFTAYNLRKLCLAAGRPA